MKKSYNCLLGISGLMVAFMLLFTPATYSQIDVTIGTGTINNTTTSYPAPYGNYWWGARHQFLVPASEILAGGGTAGPITALAFDVVSVAGTPLTDFEIKIGTTTASDLTTWHTGTMDPVFFTPTYNETVGWNTHTFTMPFIWDGVSNLVIETCFNNSSWTNNAIVNQSATAYNSSVWYNADMATVCTSTTVSGSIMQRPNMKLTFTAGNPVDAGILAITSPTYPTAMPGVHDVEAVLINFGMDPLVSADINWSIDGVLQTPYSWTGSLATGVSSAPILLGSHNFPAGFATIKVWSSNPNNVVDPNPANDTLELTFEFATTVTIGTGTATSYFYGPIYRSSATSTFDYSSYVYLYDASELAAIPPGAMITEIAWEKANAESMTGNNFVEILLENTTQATIPMSSNYTAETTNSTVVYSTNTYTVPGVAGWHTHALTTPFIYDGTNLKIAVDHHKQGTASGVINYFHSSAPDMGGGFASSSPTNQSTFTTSYSNQRPNIRINYIVPNMSDDAGVVSIDAPSFPSEPGMHDVKVTITTLGNNNLTSCNINWSVNGVLQTPYAWTGNLAKFQQDDSVHIGSFNFPQGVNEIVVWTSDPNNQVDSFPDNDTASVAFLFTQPLSGVYTIGGPGADFADFDEAITAMDAGGLAGPVTFNVNPAAGPYQGGFELFQFAGASATNTITFNGNGSVIEVGAQNYAIAINGLSHLTIDDFQIINPDPTQNKFGIMIRGGAQHINITNNYIDMGTGYTLSTSGCIVVSGSTTSAITTGNNAQYVTITNNELVGGYYGISLYGQSSYQDNYGHVVTDNIIRDWHYYGIRTQDADTLLIARNTLSRAHRQSTYTIYYAIYNVRLRHSSIIDNHIHSTGPTTSSSYGIYTSASENTAGYPTEYINNAIYNFTTTGLSYGIYLLGIQDHVNVYHNTVAFDQDGTGARRGLWVSGSTTQVDNFNVMNNIFSIDGDGTGTKYCIYMTNAVTFNANHNVLHMGATAGTNHLGYYGSNQTTLADWQMATMQDAMSVNVAPVFAAPAMGDPTPLSMAIDDMGTPVGVTTDIFGNPRSTTTPDVGAVEFTGIAADLAIQGGELVNGECLSTNDSVYITFANVIGSQVNFSTATTTVYWDVTGPVNSSGSIVVNTGTLDPVSSITVGGAGVDLSVPGIYTLSAWLGANTVNLFQGNDTLWEFTTHQIFSPFSVTPQSILVTDPTETVNISAMSRFFPGGDFFITEICQWYAASNGTPPGGYPSWLPSVDFMEITGVPNSDLGGYTLEQWSTSALTDSYTFPPGTLLSPNGTAVIRIGSGSAGSDPANFYYDGVGGSASWSSATPSGRIIKDPSGNIVDAVGYSSNTVQYDFPAAAGVSPSDWSGYIPGANSTAGIRLIGPYTKDATNWVVADGSPHVQDPGSLNSGVTLPTPGAVTGFTWSHNGVVFANDVIDTVVGPWTTPGVYQYVASYITPCGTLTDTVTVIFGSANFTGDSLVCQGDSAMLVIDLPGTGPWTIIATDGMMVDTLFATSMPASMYVYPTITTTYDIIEWKMGTGDFIPSNLSHTVVVNPAPTVTLDPLPTVCLSAAPVTLSGGLPAGGTFDGPGVSAGVFDPAVAGAGSHAITYTYTDALGCVGSDVQNLVVSEGPNFLLTTDHDICEGESTTLEVTIPGAAVPSLFFSEYIEGTSNNRALELFNGTPDTLDLANYRIAEAVSGGGWTYWHTFPAGAMLPPHHTWVIVASQVNPIYYDTANADEVLPWPSVVHFTGNDARAIEVTHDGGTTWTIIDVIGEPNNDPGVGWAVAGVNNATADNTLIRKPDIYNGNDNWAAVAGTDSASSEYVVHPVNYFGNLGSHTYNAPATLSLTYEWSTGATTPSITVAPTTTTTYYVTVTDAVTSCESVDSIVVTVLPTPTVSLGADYDICDDASTTLDAGAGFASYLWSTGATTQTIVVDGANIGTNNTVMFTVTVTNADGCEATSDISITAIDCTGIDEAEENHELTIWPNPNDGTFYLKINGITGKANVMVTNITGQVISSEQITLAGETMKEYNLSHFAPGIYFIRLQSATAVVTKQVIVK